MTKLNLTPLRPISHVLLDIEGTTCPVSYVSDILFPYATDHLESFLQEHSATEPVSTLVQQLERCWHEDSDPEARSLLSSRGEERDVLPYLLWLIRKDRKLTALKELQGLIWENGYQSGKLQGPLFADVAPALHNWRSTGLQLAVYSSGSVRAQQLLYAHSNAGDLRNLFDHWFDTKIGSKLEEYSYQKIANSLGAKASQILFISDSIGELEAARSAKLQVLHCDRTKREPIQEPIEAAGHDAKPADNQDSIAALNMNRIDAAITSIHSFEELTTLPVAIANH